MAITEDKVKNKKTGKMPEWFNRLPGGRGNQASSSQKRARGADFAKLSPQLAGGSFQKSRGMQLAPGMKQGFENLAPFSWNNIIGAFQPRAGAIQALQGMMHGMPVRNGGMGSPQMDQGAGFGAQGGAPYGPPPSPTQQAVGYWTNNSMGPDLAPQPPPQGAQYGSGWGWAQPPMPPPPPQQIPGGWGWAGQMQPPGSPPPPPPQPYWPGSYAAPPQGQQGFAQGPWGGWAR